MTSFYLTHEGWCGRGVGVGWRILKDTKDSQTSLFLGTPAPLAGLSTVISETSWQPRRCAKIGRASATFPKSQCIVDHGARPLLPRSTS